MSSFASLPFVGLAPFLRLNINGEDLRPIAQDLLAQAQRAPDDAAAWMNLATVMLCLEQPALGLAMQAEALKRQRVFPLPALRQPAVLRVLLLMAPGDLTANTPFDCLLEDSDIDLIHYFLAAPPQILPEALPPHDLAIVALSESDANHALLAALPAVLAEWSVPVLNAPQAIANTGREQASAVLADAPGVFIPPTLPVSRADLQAVADGAALASLLPAGWPVILRPRDSHAGNDLERLADAAALGDYLKHVAGEHFFLSPFVDYSGPDGRFRKYRVVLVDGRPYASHMGVSSHWMVHYLNAGMYEDAAKRAEEGAWMEGFEAFAARHADALRAIHQRSELDYVCIDCAELPDGRLFVFEIDHAMVVHAMDPATLFPYKQTHMAKVREGLRTFLLQRAGREA